MAYIPIDFGTNNGAGNNGETVQKPTKYIPIQGLPKVSQSTYQPFTGAGYFPATDINKSSTDPYSGRPFQGYTFNIPKSAINPEVNIPSIDTTRVAAGFDPTKAQTLPKQVLENPRMSEAASQAIKSAIHGNGTDELDHIIALGLSGSNAPTNLQIQPGIKGGESSVSDKLENSLIEQVKQGKISLIDAQNQLAKAKGITLPENSGQRSKTDQWLMDHPSILKPLADLQTNPLGTIGKGLSWIWNGIKSAVSNPQSTAAGAGTAIENFGLGVAKALIKSATQTPFTSVGISGITPNQPIKDAGQKAIDYLQTQGDAFGQVVQQNIPQDTNAQTAYQVGSFVGSFIPYTIMGGVVEKGAMEGAVNIVPTTLKMSTISNIGKIVKYASNLGGFIATGQITHNPDEGSRVDQLKNDLIMYALFESGIGAIKGISKIAGKVAPILKKMKSGEPITLTEGEKAVQDANAILKQETGKNPQQIIADEVKNKETISAPQTIKPNEEKPAIKPNEIKPEETKPQAIKPNKTIPKELEPLAKEVKPEVKLNKPVSEMTAAEAKTAGLSFDEWVKEQGTPDLQQTFTPTGGMLNIFKRKSYREVLDYAAKNRDFYLPSAEKDLLKSIESGGGIISGEDIPIKLQNAEGGSIKLTPAQAKYFLDSREGLIKPLSQLKAEWDKIPEPTKIKPNAETEKITIPEPTQPTKTIELTSGLNPKLDKFIEQDIKPTAKAVIGGVKGAFKTLKDLFVPTKASEESIKTSSILRTELSKQARERELLYHKISDARKVFDRYAPKQSLDFIDKIETGKPIEGSENFVKVIRDAFDSRWNKIQDIKGTDAYIENYFPHLWKDPEKASETLAKYFGKRPLEGTKSFLKQRKIPTIKEGVGLGLEPVSYNPVDLVMARIADMDKFVMAHNVVDAFKDEGLMKTVKFGDKPPSGWVKINDKIGEVYQFSETEKGLVKRGTNYMPKDAARIINNYLSPGLQGNPIYDVFRKSGNFMTQLNLGLSFFHGLFTTNDAMVSKVALGLQKLSRGELKGAGKTVLESPTYLFKNFIHGNKLLQDYFRDNPQMPELVDSLVKAGGRVRMDSFYKNSATEGFMKALRSENYLGAAVRTPGALVESISKPILQELVPRQKLGVFMDLAKDISDQAKRENWSDAKTTLRLQEAWDSVDNRLGELVYDNLFWNKALKDLSMGSVRAVGWNLGTIRELGGGLKDIVSIPYKLATGGEIRMTPRMAYTITLPIIVGLEGAILYYLLNGKRPETLLDYYYPKTGKKNANGTDERISLPSYIKDVFAVANEGLLKVASNKLNPVFSTLSDMLQNKDYYGTEIKNSNDTLVKQIGQEFQFLASQFEPFSVQSAIRGQSPAAKYGSFVGITVAPSYITQTPLEKKISGMYTNRFGQTTQTQAQKAGQDFKSQIRKAYIAGDATTANNLLKEAEQKGYFTTKSSETSFINDSDLPSGIRMFRRLPSEDQQNLLKQMNLAELNQYAWVANKETKSKLSTLSDNAKQFVDMVNNGEIKQPIWKAGKIINQ